jgi:hypothetical protein
MNAIELRKRTIASREPVEMFDRLASIYENGKLALQNPQVAPAATIARCVAGGMRTAC